MGSDNHLVSLIEATCRRRPEVELALLFGSQARGAARADSDVDIAVWAPGADLLALGAELGRVLGKDVDVVSLEDPGVPLLEELIRDAVVVFERRPGAAPTWRAHALATLETDRPWFARMRDAWLKTVAAQGV